MKRLEFIEIDIEYCSLKYGELPCGASGGNPCFNTKGTCQARTTYANELVTLRFAVGAQYLNDSKIDIVAPCVERISYSAGEVSLGENLGKRSSLSIEMSDFPYSDTGRGFDKYHASRNYDPMKLGTFWGKFRARHPYLRGRALRWIQGDSSQSLDQMEVRHFVIDNFDGPDLNGRFSITAKDILKLADNDRVKVPLASRGFLLGDITETQTVFNIGPAGIGNLEYPSSGIINIAGREICSFTRVNDQFTIVRGSEGTAPSTHKAQDRVQICKAYEGEDPADIIADLLINYANIPSEFIPLEDWRAETSAFYRRRNTRIIPDPVGVSKVVSELIQQVGLMVWWDENTKLIRLKVLRSIDTDALIYDDKNTLVGSFRQKENPGDRVSQVITYFGARSPLVSSTEPTSYHSLQYDVNLQAEDDYGDSIVKTVHGTWIPQFGRPVARRLNEIFMGRFVNPPREFQFSAFRQEFVIPPLAGDGYRLYSRVLQSATGGELGIPVQVTRVVPKPEGFDVTAVEMLFTDFSEEDLNDRTIVIDGNYYNFNWRQAYDRMYPAPKAGDKIECYISEGATVGSQVFGRAAFEVGNWPADIELKLFIRGRIQGRGGNGGDGAGNNGHATHGQAGGTALYTRRPVIIEQSNQIWGGGGGGGSGTWKYGGGGGGGQGFAPGLGGTGQGDGQPGTTERPGQGNGGGNDGAPGGYAGQPGKHGLGKSWSNGGAGGAAIDGYSFLTFSSGEGNIRGSKIN